MIKCPNCGSTAQSKLIGNDYPTYLHRAETWECTCGCVVRRTMKVVSQMIKYPNEKEKSGMTKEEVTAKIIDIVERCEGKEEDCDNCAMCRFCLGYFCGEWE